MDNNERQLVRRVSLERYMVVQVMRSVRALNNEQISLNVFAQNVGWLNQQHRMALRHARTQHMGHNMFRQEAYFEHLDAINDNARNERIQQMRQLQSSANAENFNEMDHQIPANEIAEVAEINQPNDASNNALAVNNDVPTINDDAHQTANNIDSMASSLARMLSPANGHRNYLPA